MTKGRIADLAVLISIDLRVLSAQSLQFIKYFASAPHLLHRVRTKQVEVDQVQFMRVLAIITFGPFLRVTDCTHRTQVGARNKITLRIILYQIRERQFRCIGMMGMTSHNERESSYLRWPEQITIARRFSATLGYTLMDRTEFIHVIRLVRSRPGIKEREHTCYEQC